MKTIAIYLILILSSCHLVHFVKADHVEPTMKVNQNIKTDYFNDTIPEYSDLKAKTEERQRSAISGIETNNNINFLVEEDDAAIKASIDNVSSIKATDLNSRGTDEMIKQKAIYEIDVDYSEGLNKQVMVDAKKIGDGQEELLGCLLGKLKDIGVDCKVEKGLKKQEPEFFMQIEKAVEKDTVYNKAECEEPRNQYKCSDSLSVSCKSRGKGYGKWQEKTIKFNGRTLHNHKMNWGYAVKSYKKRWSWLITPHHPKCTMFGWPDQVDSCWRGNPAAIIADARIYIAAHLRVSIEQIGENIIFPPSGMGTGHMAPVGARWRWAWNEYEFKYKFREVFDTCEAWSTNWTERCSLNSISKPKISKPGQRSK